jgi:SanA protein
MLPLMLVLLIIIIVYSDWQINKYGEKYVYNDTDKIPFNEVGLILGTSKRIQNGQPNLYFRYRIRAAVELYEAGKIKHILVSGDNSLKEYNEPMDMKKALIKQGIPDTVIVLDYAGFRTFDSMVRSKKVFGQEKITVISQEFHNKRAIYIAHQKGLEAVGYNAKDISFSSGMKVQLREKMARVKVFLDLYILNTKPKFLGKKIKIG